MRASPLNLACPGLHRTQRVAETGFTGRLGEPADFGRVVAFLCSEHAGFISGAALQVDGAGTLGLLVTPTERLNDDVNDTDRAQALADRILGGAPRTGADLRHRDRRRALRRPAPRHRRGRPGDSRRPGTGPRSTSSRRSTATASTSRSARRWTCSRRSRRRRSRRSSCGPTGSTWPTTSSGRACSSATSRRSSGPTRPSTSIATSSGSAPPRRTWRRARRSPARGSRPASCRLGRSSSAPSRRWSGSSRPPAEDAPPLAAVAEDDAAARERIAGVWNGRRRPRVRPLPRRAPRVPPARRGEQRRDRPPRRRRDLRGGDPLVDHAPARSRRRCTTSATSGGRRSRPNGSRSPRASATTTPPTAIADRKASGKDTPASAEALVELVEDQVQRSWDIAPQWFGRLPKANCRVREIEAYRAADMAARVLHAAHGGRRAARHLLHQHARPAGQGAPPDRRRSPTTRRTRATISRSPSRWSSTTVPRSGASAGSWPDRPSPRAGGSTASGSPTTWASTSTIGSGWGCWPRQAHRAARLITDTGLHAFGWTRERAIEKLVAGGSPRGESEVEVDRYIALPAQALAYMVGMVEIEDARRRTEEKEGAAFDLKALPRPAARARTAPAPGAPARARLGASSRACGPSSSR